MKSAKPYTTSERLLPILQLKTAVSEVVLDYLQVERVQSEWQQTLAGHRAYSSLSSQISFEKTSDWKSVLENGLFWLAVSPTMIGKTETCPCSGPSNSGSSASNSIADHSKKSTCRY